MARGELLYANYKIDVRTPRGGCKVPTIGKELVCTCSAGLGGVMLLQASCPGAAGIARQGLAAQAC